MAIFSRFAASITSLSRMDPPGWTSAVAPAFAATSRVSGKGRNASDATADPASGAQALSIAIFAEFDPTHLSCTDAKGTLLVGKDDRVAFRVLADFPGNP